MKIRRLTLGKHLEIAAKLREHHEAMLDFAILLSKIYGKSSKIRRRINPVLKANDQLRGDLENILIEDYPDDSWKVYFGDY